MDDDPLGRLAVAAAARTVLDSEIAATTPTRQDSSGTWLQLGAFGNRDNAESFLAHMQREFPAEIADTMRVRSDGRLHRIQSGPLRHAGRGATRDAPDRTNSGHLTGAGQACR